jgi:hypothetical protein
MSQTRLTCNDIIHTSRVEPCTALPAQADDDDSARARLGNTLLEKNLSLSFHCQCVVLSFPVNKVGQEKAKAGTLEQNGLTPLLVVPAEEQKMESASALKMGIQR